MDVHKTMNSFSITFRYFIICLCLFFTQESYAALKQLYLDNQGAGPYLTRLLPAGNVSQALDQGDPPVIMDQQPLFQAPFTISATDINVTLVLQKTGPGNFRSTRVDLYINGTSGIFIGSDEVIWGGGGQNVVPFTITNSTVRNLVAGEYITLVVRNTGTGNTVGNTVIRFQAGGSYVEMQTDTVINLDAVGIHSAAYPDPEEYSSYIAGTTIYLRATVSDPFGFADISSVDFSVNDPNSPPSVFTANIITPEAGAGAATAVFETPYTIPASPAPDGVWSVDFVANEGSEGMVTSAANKTFSVGTPVLTVRKSSKVDNDPVNITTYPKAIPNSHVEYTVEVTNSGYGSPDNNSIFITDPIPAAQTTFYFGNPVNPVRFVDGAIPSGLTLSFLGLDDPTDDIDFYSDAACTAIITTPVADASGYDISSPKVQCIGISPKGVFKGSADLVNLPGFSVNFTVRLD